MAAAEDFNKPTINNPVDTDCDAIRDNYQFLLLTAANAAGVMSTWSVIGEKMWLVIPGWTTTVNIDSNNDYSQPDAIILTRGSRVIRFNYTWELLDALYTRVTAIEMCYDDGVSGSVCFDSIPLYYQGGYLSGTVTTTTLDFFNTAADENKYPSDPSSPSLTYDYWDLPSDVLSDTRPAVYQQFQSANNHDYSQYLILHDPISGLSVPVGAVITNIRIDVELNYESTTTTTATIENLSIEGGTLLGGVALIETDNTINTFTGDLAYWGLTNAQALLFADGTNYFRFQVLFVQTSSPGDDMELKCYNVKAQFTYY